MTDEGTRSMNAAIDELRGMQPNERCEAIISLFSMVVAEFATMVLEHCEQTPIAPEAKRVAKKLQRKLKRRA